jgi:predicted DNA-binding transcriptional regulator YafY
MSPSERREALLGWLRSRGSGTAAEVAQHLGVSERTVYRDVAALRDRGEPLEADSGPGGGLRLHPSALLPPVRLHVEEVVGLTLSLHLARQASPQAPFSRAADAGLERLTSSLPPERLRELQRLLQRVVLGRPASPTVARSAGPVEPSLLLAFERAFRTRRALGFGYLDRHGRHSERRIEPHGLLLQAPLWYVLAVDLVRQAPRMFRMDRIDRPRVLDEIPFEPRPVEVLGALVIPEMVPGALP